MNTETENLAVPLLLGAVVVLLAIVFLQWIQLDGLRHELEQAAQPPDLETCVTDTDCEDAAQRLFDDIERATLRELRETGIAL